MRFGVKQSSESIQRKIREELLESHSGEERENAICQRCTLTYQHERGLDFKKPKQLRHETDTDKVCLPTDLQSEPVSSREKEYNCLWSSLPEQR